MPDQPRRKRTRRRRGGGRGCPSSASPNQSRNASEPHGERRVLNELCVLGPFSVFCALYLGITRDNGYAAQSQGTVARAFGINVDELETFLADHHLTREDLSERKFDFEAARFDIKVAPAGISRIELARNIFEELLGAKSA